MFGLATPTEAAAVGAFGSILLAVAYRSFTWGRLKESVYLTARTSAMVCFLFVGSATFAGVFGYLGGQAVIEKFVLGLNMNPITFLIVAQFIIFLLGWPLEWTEIIIIFVPIFLPMLKHFNIDPLMFGLLVALNLQTAFLSPPMAMAAYYLKGIAPQARAADADLPRLHAVPLHRAAVAWSGVHLAGDGDVAAEGDLRQLRPWTRPS